MTRVTTITVFEPNNELVNEFTPQVNEFTPLLVIIRATMKKLMGLRPNTH